jgi:cation diffusion facilitator family transporter
MLETSGETSGQTRTTVVSVAAATVLVILKLGTGLATGSLGLVSAGIESSGDVIAAVLTLLAVRLALRPADEDHPYGHRRAENLAALGEAAILTGGGSVVLVKAIDRLTGAGVSLTANWYVFAVIGVALAIDASRTLVSARSAAKYRSAALRANAFHFAGDMAGSLAVLAGLVAVASGFEDGDAIAAVIVAFIIFAAAARLIYDNARVLMDTAPAQANQEARNAVEALGQGVDLRRLRLRESGGRYFADAVVAVPPGQAVVEGHVTADDVEEAIRGALPDSDVVVHLEPQSENLDPRDRALAAALAEPAVREVHDIVLYQQDGQFNVSLHLKLSPDMPLREAHEAAERVERAIAADPEVASVQTHLEPLEQPQSAATRDRDAAGQLTGLDEQVVALTRHEPIKTKLIRAARGQVVFLTVAVAADLSLSEAHELAGRLEEEIRRSHPHLVDVVVHTEPLER